MASLSTTLNLIRLIVPNKFEYDIFIEKSVLIGVLESTDSGYIILRSFSYSTFF